MFIEQSRDEIKALRARLDAMQSRLADAKKDIVAGKDQVAKTKGKNLQSVSNGHCSRVNSFLIIFQQLQDQAAALKNDRNELKKISDEVSSDLSKSLLYFFPCR